MSYSLVEQIGKGGMGVVWKARDDETGQIVALKLLRDGHSDDPEYRRRFEHELAIASRITSPHVVKVLGYGEREGQPYIAFELVEGTSLRQMIADYGPSTWPAARTILLQLAEGLADAHAAGVIHRDVKPSNVLIGPDGIARLTDFGIARGLDTTRMTATSTPGIAVRSSTRARSIASPSGASADICASPGIAPPVICSYARIFMKKDYP